MKFELTEKRETRTTVTISIEVWTLLHEMAGGLAPRPIIGGKLVSQLSGARGEIEIGIEGGAQYKLRVIED